MKSSESVYIVTTDKANLMLHVTYYTYAKINIYCCKITATSTLNPVMHTNKKNSSKNVRDK